MQECTLHEVQKQAKLTLLGIRILVIFCWGEKQWLEEGKAMFWGIIGNVLFPNMSASYVYVLFVKIRQLTYSMCTFLSMH